jgi:MBOAT, membrane-bound O-acyltransferase family
MTDPEPLLRKFMNSTIVQMLEPVADRLGLLGGANITSYLIPLGFTDTKIQPIADSVGVSLPLIKYAISLFLAYPFAAVMNVMPNRRLKHLVSIIGGVLFVQWVFGPDWIHSFISSAVTYLICGFVPREFCPVLVFMWAMGYMTCVHVNNMYVSYMTGEFDFSGTQMVLTMKLISFAYNLYDGTHDRKNVFPITPHGDSRKEAVYRGRQRYAITELPGPLEFFGYMYCFSCLLAGPAFEYKDYVEVIDGSAFAFVQDPSIVHEQTKKKGTSIPSSVLPALQRLVIAVVCLAAHLYLSKFFSFSNIYNTEWILDHWYVQRLVLTMLTIFMERLKYYFAWKAAEGASILCGFGFQGYNEKGEVIGWRGVENVDIIAVETATSVQALTRSWNMRTQGWLERYVYLRSGRSLLVTYFISALWHGLYPSFYVLFMTVALMTIVERLVKSKISPLIVPEYDGRDMRTYPKTLVGYAYLVTCWTMTTAFVSYTVQVFPIGSLARCHLALGGYHYAPHIVLLSAYGILSLLPVPHNAKKTAVLHGSPNGSPNRMTGLHEKSN